MRNYPRSLVLLVFLWSQFAPLAAQEEPEQRLWKETGDTRHGVLEGQRGRSLTRDEAGQVDAATLEQLARRWERLRAKQPHIPELKYMEAVDPGRAPASPPTEVGARGRAPSDFLFVRNSDPSAAIPGGFSATVNEPSVAISRAGGVFYSGNWYGLSSSDRGETFSYFNVFNGPYPPATGGLCCDQVTVYDPGTDAIFFLQQYIGDVTNNTQRINVDQGGDGTFDCFYNVTPQIMGFGANNFADFPDLAVSIGHLYHSSNVFSTTGGGFTGAFVARYPLDQIGTCAGSIPFDVYTDASFFSFKLSRGATFTMYFADHITNASLRIWTWTEGGASPTFFDRTVTAWTNNPRTCPGPDGRDWCGFIDQRIAGAWVGDGKVGFMWVPSQDATFPLPYTRVAQFTQAFLELTGEPIIWSGSLAWGYPSVAVNRNGDLGGTIMAGGPGLHPACVAWIADDVNGDAIAPLENQVALFGTSGPSTPRAGDYNSAQPNQPNDLLWAGACFAYLSPDAASQRFLIFGREGSHAIFADGFESGNTSAWSASVP